MNNQQPYQQKHLYTSAVVLILIILLAGLNACKPQTPVMLSAATQTPTVTNTPPPTRTPRNTTTPTRTATPTPPQAAAYVANIWGTFAAPTMDSVTPIPPPVQNLVNDPEVVVWVLLGLDAEPPFNGRTEAIHLIFYHPRFARASLVSIPGSLYVYIPGYAMQRISTAYTVGGIDLLYQTLAYNFGVFPSRYMLAHPGDFLWLVDDLHGLDVMVFFPMPNACGGLPSGVLHMDGETALCYASHVERMDEMDRLRRQQQLLRLIFLKLAYNGNLVRLPELYANYKDWIKTDLSLGELKGLIPLALKLADPQRITYYIVDWQAIIQWDLPDHTQAKVFLPVADEIAKIMNQAYNDVLIPGAMSDLVLTLEWQLTTSPTPTTSSNSSTQPAVLPGATPTAGAAATMTPFPFTATPMPGYP